MSDLNFDEDVPRFPALARCLIIESSHRLRNEVIKEIKTAQIFENILEAASLDDAEKKISTISFDACVLGPSTNPETGKEFINKNKKLALSKDIAFVYVVKFEVDDAPYVGAHGIAKTPSVKKKTLTDFAKAILTANKNLAWPGIKLNEDGQIMMLDGAEWKVIKSDDYSRETPKALPENFKLSGDKESIEKFCDSINTTPKSRIEAIIKSLIFGSSNPDTQEFANYFLQAINEWKTDMTFMTLKEASSALKERLLMFDKSRSL